MDVSKVVEATSKMVLLLIENLLARDISMYKNFDRNLILVKILIPWHLQMVERIIKGQYRSLRPIIHFHQLSVIVFRTENETVRKTRLEFTRETLDKCPIPFMTKIIWKLFESAITSLHPQLLLLGDRIYFDSRLDEIKEQIAKLGSFNAIIYANAPQAEYTVGSVIARVSVDNTDQATLGDLVTATSMLQEKPAL